MTKYILDLELISKEILNEGYVVLRLTDPQAPLPAMRPGQFVEVRVDGSPTTFLRRPISINRVVRESNELWLLVHAVGDGTRRMASLEAGATVNVVLPLGNGWSLGDGPSATGEGRRRLLVGGGVGAAPLFMLAEALNDAGCTTDVVLGAQTASRLWGETDALALGAGEVMVCTDDGSYGMRGFATIAVEKLFSANEYDLVVTCGPNVMMGAVARIAEDAGVECQASLERMMTCGFGACSTCNVAMRAGGYKACCMDGPVFDAKEVAW